MRLLHIPQCPIQNRNVHISVLNGALWDMEQVHSGICEFGQLLLNNTISTIRDQMLYLANEQIAMTQLTLKCDYRYDIQKRLKKSCIPVNKWYNLSLTRKYRICSHRIIYDKHDLKFPLVAKQLLYVSSRGVLTDTCSYSFLSKIVRLCYRGRRYTYLFFFHLDVAIIEFTAEKGWFQSKLIGTYWHIYAPVN